MTFYEKFINSMKAIGEFVTICSPVIIAYFSYLQVKIIKKQNAIHREMNGMKDELIRASKEASHAEGKAEGIREQKLENGNK